MESQHSLATKQDLDYLQTQMKNVYATQAEHADRLVRLEHRSDDPPRAKSIWGTHSPLTGLLNGTSQTDSAYNPAAEAFKNFDQDQSGSMIGSLHLDGDEEPRRGASRANSVRFDEKAIHGHFGQYNRSGNESLPSRTGSAFGPHPLGERSLSHKSDGRQSSSHSARHSSIGNDSRPLSATAASFAPDAAATAPPPGVYYLGPVPSIIRCWMDTNYSNDTLMYAAVCSGSYKSLLNVRILEKLSLTQHISTDNDGHEIIKLPVYLPEATIQTSASRSPSPFPHLPALTTEFRIQRFSMPSSSINIFLGCDILRLRNADIQMSLDRLSILDDERNKVTVPLVRPENAGLFRNLQTLPAFPFTDSSISSTRPSSRLTNHYAENETQKEISQSHADARSAQSSADTAPSPPSSPPPEKADSSEEHNGGAGEQGSHNPSASESGTQVLSPIVDNGSTNASSRSESGSLWGSWRQSPAQANRMEGNSSASGYQRAGRGRGMKILKPARLSTARTPSLPVGFDALPARTGEQSKAAVSRNQNMSPSATVERMPASAEVKTPSSSKTKSSNPVGGASAFGWLNNAGSRE